MKDNIIQAIQLQVNLDIIHGVKYPNNSWPEFLADFYNKLSKKEREKTMSTKLVKKETAEKEVTKKVSKKIAAKKVSKKVSAKRPQSKSGKYKNIRHLLEALFHKNSNLTSEQAMQEVKKEFPTSKYVESNHYPWYKTHIINKNEWIHFDKPKVKMAKIKTQKQAA